MVEHLHNACERVKVAGKEAGCERKRRGLGEKEWSLFEAGVLT